MLYSALTSLPFLLLAGPAMATDLSTIDEHILVRCEDILPADLRQKHFGGKDARVASKDHADCVFDSRPIREVATFCGKEDEKDRLLKPPGKTTPIPDLEDNGHFQSFNGELIVAFTDKDTPCTVVIHADPKDPTDEAKSVALARDIAKVLTPEVVAKRRTVEALLWAQDSSGDKAKAALQEWPKDAEVLKTVVSFAPGFPKAVDHGQKPGWPAGKQSLVLGYCANFKGADQVKALKAALPGIEAVRIPAEGTVPSCPTPVGAYGKADVVGKTVRVGKDELSVAAFTIPRNDVVHDQEHLTVHAYLRDRAGRLIDSHEVTEIASSVFDVVRLRKSGTGISVNTFDDLSGLFFCKNGVKVKRTVQVSVQDGKVTAETTREGMPDCVGAQ